MFNYVLCLTFFKWFFNFCLREREARLVPYNTSFGFDKLFFDFHNLFFDLTSCSMVSTMCSTSCPRCSMVPTRCSTSFTSCSTVFLRAPVICCSYSIKYPFVEWNTSRTNELDPLCNSSASVKNLHRYYL